MPSTLRMFLFEIVRKTQGTKDDLPRLAVFSGGGCGRTAQRQTHLLFFRRFRRRVWRRVSLYLSLFLCQSTRRRPNSLHLTLVGQYLPPPTKTLPQAAQVESRFCPAK